MQSAGKAEPGIDRAGEPFRDELLSPERLADAGRAEARAASWSAAPSRRPMPLRGQLIDSGARIGRTVASLASIVRSGRAVPPAVEWLLDNSYLIDEQVRAVMEDLPPEYGAELPRLTTDPFKGYPRVWRAALVLIAHTDSRLDTDSLERFVNGYQEIEPLTIGETWAVPIVLRVALVENLRRLAERVAGQLRSELAAEVWADRMVASLDTSGTAVDGLLAELSREPALAADPLPLLVRLMQRMRDQDRDVAPITSWIERSLAERHSDYEQAVREQQQRRAADQVSIANAITSIRYIEASDWRLFFERTNPVEKVLCTDPARIYEAMDFLSRDRYRHALEALAKGTAETQLQLANRVVERARSALAGDATDLVRGHVGWYLISDGRYELERAVSYTPSQRERRQRGVLRSHWLVYGGMIGLVVVALAGTLAWWSASEGTAPWAVVLLTLLSLIPLSSIGIELANRVAAAIWPPRRLPKLDAERPVSQTFRTLAVVPSLLTSTDEVAQLLERLEVHLLANRDPDIHFALLGDLRAADAAETPSDAVVLAAARDGIRDLNDRYREDGSGPFHLFVRSRLFDEEEGVWMGWERKRGALTELCRLLRGDASTSISLVEGAGDFLPGVTFVITLDADTVLPRDAARGLVSTIAHPLNRARVDGRTKTVREGYGLVQPRVSMTLASASATPYARLRTGPAGIDPYAGAASDVYQDVFGEGSFTGKGIFEVDVFNAVLEGRFPDDALLSHDLLEGNFLRTALVSDIEVLDETPADYAGDAIRTHRWTRGDWQTWPWLLAYAPGRDGVRYRNPLRWLHRYKMLDNLRRSLMPMAMLLFGAFGWLSLPRPGIVWPVSFMVLVAFPALAHAVDTLVRIPHGAGIRGVLRPAWSELKKDASVAAVSVIVLPHQAHLLMDAALRALWRMLVSHHGLLEWTTAAEAKAASGGGLRRYVRLMGPSIAAASVVAAALMALKPESALLLAPGIALWIAAPFVAWRLSQPYPAQRPAPSAAEVAAMRSVARRTWRFFERFVADEDHWLPPDNYQEDPKGEIAHRTSPTNMGLALLADLTAHDLGYIALSDLVDRVSRTLETMAGLERFRGHFYNWYDTLSLRPLRPAYVSTVDSGNLAGDLLVLRCGMREAVTGPLVGPNVLDGIADGLRLALEELRDARGGAALGPGADDLQRGVDELLRRVALVERPRSLGGWYAVLGELARRVEPLPRTAAVVWGYESPSADAVAEVARCIERQHDDIEACAPWIGLLAAPPRDLARGGEPGLEPLFASVPSLQDLADPDYPVLAALDAIAARAGAEGRSGAETAAWAEAVADGMRDARTGCSHLLARSRLTEDIATEMWDHLDLRLLYDAQRELFSIGFNTEQGRCDDSYYDMLASECRLTSFLAVARGDVTQEHWFRLGRPLTRSAGDFALLSWSASMFEYLMPLLLMRSYPGTLLERTCETVVRRQIEYGAERGVPWGVSESAFNAKDAELTYQYQAFGVPGLGLKRGLSDDLVVAPYATLLAAQVDRPAALRNLTRLEKEGALGRYGFFEALDYTPGRVPAGSRRAVVRTYMAHHQGMSLLALGNQLTDDATVRRFHSDPLVAAGELLLQERVPRVIRPAHPHVEEVEYVRAQREPPPPVNRSYATPNTPAPATHFLSNGRYSVMVTNAGGGYSRWGDLAVSRYREDITRDCWGQFLFIRDVRSGRTWSATHQPAGVPADDYHCILSADRAEFRRRDGDLETYTEVAVSPEDDVEVRRTAITNHGRGRVTLQLTSYFEVALAPQASDQAHRTFSNLFVETEAFPDLSTLLFTRRPRSAEEPRHWGVHTLACDAPGPCAASWETDRERFIGRLNSVRTATAITAPGPLSNTVGPVLDPVCALRREVTISSGETVRVAYTTGVADARDKAIALAEKYQDIRAAQRAIDLAWGTSAVELRDLGITPEEAIIYQRLASRMVLTDPDARLKEKPDVENRLPMSGLWGIGISGDNPILLVRIERLEDTPFVRQCLLAHQYWRHKGLTVDLVILNTKATAYSSELDERLKLLVRTGHALQMVDKPGGVFIRTADTLAPEVTNLLTSVARAALDADAGPIALQMDRRAVRPDMPDTLVPRATPAEHPATSFRRPELRFDNGLGGVDEDTGEYVIVLEGDAVTPAPWINVIANPEFGTMVSEAGVGCTWAKNSHENRLTTWNNDPVCDGSGEIMYLRDETTGEVWSPTPLPARDAEPYVIRHGHGYSVFEHTCHGVEQKLTWFVAADEPVRVAALRLTNAGDQPRTLSVTQFVEWVLGDSRSRANQRVVTRYDTDASMLTAHSYFNEDFPGRIAFLATDASDVSYTGDRTEFLGRNGSPADPAALRRRSLGGITGRFRDTCGALMATVELAPGESADVRFFLGQTDTLDDARRLVRAYRQPGHADEALAAAKAGWADILGTLEVSTPDGAMDEMANGRALYQALSCRMWGRTAMYQSSGAYGFRDQLQDSMALVLARPDLTRAQIVEASRHQFEEGDVLHWWQPHSGRGVRTRFTDDRVWLPFVVADYLTATGDRSVLEERTSFIAGPPVPEDHEDVYMVPSVTRIEATVYEHCLRALDASRATGGHGLPLMGGGDWNDGMNRVGIGGTGESVWLAWFLNLTLRRFAPVCESMGDSERAEDYRAWATRLAEAVEDEAWDGAWYRRAYFDDGTPLGTAQATECRIDAIAQAWSVISGAGDPRRALTALESVEEKLVRWENGLIALLTPPFDHMRHDPGYIKGYVPGVRENGGQYTHAALWVVMAYALMGDGDEAVALLGLINPLNHSRTRSQAYRYRVEPYVVPADVYAVSPHTGRGGWTWYTGSASWFHTVTTRTILGISTVAAPEGGRMLVVDPSIPKAWEGFSADVRIGATSWHIQVDNPRGVNRGVDRVTLDGVRRADLRIPLEDDGVAHEVVVTMLGG